MSVDKEKLMEDILRSIIIKIQQSGAGYFAIDPRTYPAELPAISIINNEMHLINQRKSDMSASQRIKVTELHKSVNEPRTAKKESEPQIQKGSDVVTNEREQAPELNIT